MSDSLLDRVQHRLPGPEHAGPWVSLPGSRSGRRGEWIALRALRSTCATADRTMWPCSSPDPRHRGRPGAAAATRPPPPAWRGSPGSSRAAGSPRPGTPYATGARARADQRLALGLGALPLGDDLAEEDQPADRAVRRPPRLDLPVEPLRSHLRARRGPRRSARRPRPGSAGGSPSSAPGLRGNVVVGPADQISSIQAVVADPAVAGDEVAQVPVQHRHGDRRLLHELAERGLGGAGRLEGLLALGRPLGQPIPQRRERPSQHRTSDAPPVGTGAVESPSASRSTDALRVASGAVTRREMHYADDGRDRDGQHQQAVRDLA